MDFDLTADQALIRTTVKDFADHVVAPGAAERDETGEVPLDIMRQMGELGLFGIPFPERWGGSGGDTVSYALAVEEIGRVDASLGLGFAAHVSLGCSPLYLYGSDAQRERFLIPAATGQYLAAFGLTEPGAGSDAGGTATRVEETPDGYRITGTKIFITNALHAGYIVATARQPGDQKISSYIVPAGTPGLTVRADYQKLGMRSSETCEIHLDGVEVPRELRLGEPGRGFRQFLEILDGGRISIGALSVGVAQASLDAALAYSQARRQFGHELAHFQAIQFKLADMALEVELARTMVLKAAWLKDQHREYAKEAAMAKLYASEAAMRASLEAVQIHGGYGYIGEFPVERHFRDVRVTLIYEGTNEVQRLVVGRSLVT